MAYRGVLLLMLLLLFLFLAVQVGKFIKVQVRSGDVRAGWFKGQLSERPFLLWRR